MYHINYSKDLKESSPNYRKIVLKTFFTEKFDDFVDIRL